MHEYDGNRESDSRPQFIGVNTTFRRMRICHLVTLATLLAARDSSAQSIEAGAQLVPVVTRADPTATRADLTEGYLAQPIAMVHAKRGSLRGIGTLNLEGLSMQRGELVTGAFGEGFVDRRHPHAYIHELLAGVEFPRDGTAQRPPFDASLFFGRGFAPFGSDDPMTRPFEKYPVNHHLGQVLERVLAVAAVRYGPIIGEFGVFNGDEPTGPAAAPNWGRFGDSWSTRLTLLPSPHTELSGSVAHVTSPEIRAGHGLDQQKSSLVARYDFDHANGSRQYALVEWAHTDDTDHGTTINSLYTVLGEAAVCRADAILAARLERTDRPEEEPTSDPFRTPRPPSDLSNLGESRWTTLTIAVASPSVKAGFVRGRPFIEVARIWVAPGNPAGIFNPELRYGTDRLWMFTLGLRLTAGMMHERMGRYGAALPDAVQTLPAPAKSDSMPPDMPNMPGMPSTKPPMQSSMHMNMRCHL